MASTVIGGSGLTYDRVRAILWYEVVTTNTKITYHLAVGGHGYGAYSTSAALSTSLSCSGQTTYTTSGQGGDFSSGTDVWLNPTSGYRTYSFARDDGDYTRTIYFSLTSTGSTISGTSSGSLKITIPKLPRYTVKYAANGGSGTTTSQTKTYGVALTLRAGLTRTGYTFYRWKATNGTLYKANASYTTNAATTMTAQWTVNSYTLTYNPNGGSVSTTSKSINYGATYGTLPTPTRTGYDFNGWWTAASGGTQVTASTTMGAANTTIYAHWIEKTAILTYDNGGHGTAPEPVTMYYTTATTAESMSATGWLFQGWKRSDDESIILPEATVKLANVIPTALTLTAQWIPDTIEITLNNQEATTSGTESFYEKYGIGFYEDEECTELISNISCPIKTNYDFDGYYSGENGQGNKYIDNEGLITSLKGDFTDFMDPSGIQLYANWIPKVYQITLDDNDATTAGTLQYYEKYGVGNYSDENCTNEINRIEVPEKTGYTFNGYPYGSSWPIDYRGFIYGYTISGNTTLTADWTINQYTITAHANGGIITPEGSWEGTSKMVVKERDFNQQYGSLPFISRSGYTLDYGEEDNLSGWYTAIEGGDPVDMNTLMGATNVNIYPHWKAKNYNDENYNYITIETGKVQAISNGSSYGLIPYAIEDGNDTLIVTSLQGCFEDTDIEGNLYINCSAVTDVTDMFKEVSNNVCIIFGSEFQEFNIIWDSLVTENITYLGAEDIDYYYTADETDSSNHNLNIRVKDKSKEMYDLPALTLNDGTDDWTAATMNQCYKDCINLQGRLEVHNNPSQGYDGIFDGVTHEIYILCLDDNALSTWEYIASLDNEGESNV